ncbi:MAG TPA: tRNA (adenosine(37)-N6)-dimethylallyltransferase MiaA [Thermodesulfobacteriota bacterium]|nr:tRNA (adenosine(37)-N6)-dimethylallyltransferase MiaA [Thermodesulfobacteriota bacterium]
MKKPRVTFILGPTASGKTGLALELASLFNGEIINADSMQVYRFMDIGTAKPSKEELGRAAHHLIDVVDPDEEYTAARFRTEALEKIGEIRSRGRNVFVAGGTGLYVKVLTRGIFEGPRADPSVREALGELVRVHGKEVLHERLKEVDPESAGKIHPNNTGRLIRALEVWETAGRPISEFHREHAFGEDPLDALKIGLALDRDALYAAIERRVDGMMERGLPEETGRLVSMGYSADLKPMRGLGYKEMAGYLNGESTLEQAVALIKRNTRRYAKRQMTWFRGDPEIRWFSPAQKDDIINLVKGHLNG